MELMKDADECDGTNLKVHCDTAAQSFMALEAVQSALSARNS